MPQLRVLRTGAGSAVAPHVIRELQRSGVYVIAADMDPSAVGFLFADAAVTIPAGNDPGLVARLLEICGEHEVDVLFPDIDEELLPVAEAKHDFEQNGVRVLLSNAAAIRVASDKLLFTRRLQELGVPVPKLYSLDDLDAAEFPVFVKPRRGRGSQHTHRADDRGQLDYVLADVPDPVVQGFVAGTEYTVDGLASFEGRLLYASVRERLHTDSGISVKGRTTLAPEIEAYVATIVEGIGLVGPVCIQCIVDSEGVPHFTDCNPRLGGGTVLSVAAGAPIIADTVRLLRDEPVAGKDGYRSGLTMLRYWEEVYVDPLEGATAVVFDLDYTLYDADAFYVAALRHVADQVGKKFDRDGSELAESLLGLRRELGADHPKLFDEWLRSHDLWESDTVKACIEWFHSYEPVDDFELYPGVAETLEAMRALGLKLGIVTDGNVQMQTTKLGALGIGNMVDAVVLNAALGAPKPDPAGLLEAMSRLGVDAEDVLYVGDHPVYDIVMARNAGVRSIRVLTGAFAARPHAPNGTPDVVLADAAALHDRMTSQVRGR